MNILNVITDVFALVIKKITKMGTASLSEMLIAT